MNTKEKIVNENLGLVHACAKRFKGRGIEYDDLFQAGSLGLIKAIDGFDNDRGVKFSTYAVPVILGEIKKLFRDGGSVKVSRSLKELSLKVKREISIFSLHEGREPTINELAKILDIEPALAAQAINASMVPISLTLDNEDSEGGQIDIPVESPDEKISEHIALNQSIEKLNDKDRSLIFLRFFKGNTQTQTAKVLGMTQVQVSRREKVILRELREKLSS